MKRHKHLFDDIRLIDLIIDGSNPQEEVNDYFPGDDLFAPSTRRKGIPIGNQTSQFFANVYLNPFDHFVKDAHKDAHKGLDYVRYVDDFVVLGDDKEWLWEVRAAMDAYLQTRLRLRLHPKKQWIFPVSEGVDFLGYRVFPTHRRLRRSNGVRFQRRLRRLQQEYRMGQKTLPEVRQSIASWIGHASHADTYRLRSALLGSAVFSRASAPDARAAGRLVEQRQREQLPLRQPQQEQPRQQEQQQGISVRVCA
jgi:retron-type reverse transcriptase